MDAPGAGEQGFDDDPDVDPVGGLEVSAPLVAGLLSGSISLSTVAGGLPPWVGAFGAALSSPLIVASANAILQRQAARVQLAFDTACESGTCTFDELIQSSMSSDRKIELLSGMIRGAARSEHSSHISAMGKLLIEGVFAPLTETIQYIRIMDALAQLDSADLEFLAHVGKAPKADDGTATSFFIRDQQDSEHTLVQQLPNLRPIMDSVIAKMSTLGMMSTSTGEVTWGGISSSTSWHVTEFGNQCVGRLLAEGTE